MNKAVTKRVLLEIRNERMSQDIVWGVQDLPPIGWLTLIGEEFGEACQAANKANFEDKYYHNYRSELIQVAALAVSAIESYDRQKVRDES